MQTFQYGKKRIPDPANEGSTKQVDEKATCYEDVISKFEHHYVPKIDVVNESAKFNKRVQGDESIENFLIDLQQLVISCDYEDQDRHVRDRFIAGLCNEKIQEKLQFMADIDLHKAAEYACRWETLQNQLQNQRSAIASTNKVRSSSRGRGQGRGRGQRGWGQHRRQGRNDDRSFDQREPAQGKRCER